MSQPLCEACAMRAFIENPQLEFRPQFAEEQRCGDCGSEMGPNDILWHGVS